MRVLLDTCVWGGAAHVLVEAGFDVRWMGELPTDPGDEAVLARAADEGRVLVKLDKDFGELAIVRKLPHAGIVRLVGFSSRQQGAACVEVLRRYRQELQGGGIVTAELGRVRIRSAGA